MDVKIDTKEKFTVITPLVTQFTANMTEDLRKNLSGYLLNPVPHIVLNLENVNAIDPAIGALVADMQQKFYEQNASFVICCMQDAVEQMLDENDILALLNATPTESEAWDIVQMEEIEREIMNDFDDNN